MLVADTSRHRSRRLRSRARDGRGEGGRALPQRHDPVIDDRRRGAHSAQFRSAHPLRRVPRRARRRSGRGHRRHAGPLEAGAGAHPFGLPDRRRVRLAPLRLRRSIAASARAACRRPAAASSFISRRKAAASASPTRCAPTSCRTTASTRSMPTPRSASTTTSATMASPSACCRCSAARRVVLLTNNPAKLDGLAKAGIEIVGRMPIETPINADNPPLPDGQGGARRPPARPSGFVPQRGLQSRGTRSRIGSLSALQG